MASQQQIANEVFVRKGRDLRQVSYRQASELFCANRDRLGLGASRIRPLLLTDAAGTVVAYVSYNGRVWAGTPQAWSDQTPLIYDEAPRRVKLGLAVKWAIQTHADLTDANLTDANLTHADLTHADLTDANLTHADLRDANLRGVRVDFFDVLLRARAEIPDLLAALRAGRINGSAYEGDCACLCGTIAASRGVYFGTLDFVDSNRPAERWFLGIQKGDTPETSQIAKITEGWILEFLSFVPTPIPTSTAEVAP